MTTIELLLVAGVLAGTLAFVCGELLRHRRVRAEHWLWKKQRLMRARVLTMGGSTMSVLSAAAFMVL